ncbi:probable calcium-binding protein CML18 [Aristolochia californica]|uniref:probable calcium-binding protein CML18 n=1 Tax=Aristolochia californica TaxID=171875 RepID=UPI0035E28210
MASAPPHSHESHTPAATTATTAETEELEKVFKRFDANGDGKISSSELASVMEALGSSTSSDELQRMMAEMDSDGNGSIDFKEFEEFHRGSTQPGSAYNDLRDAFEMYDLDKNGLISAKELHKVLHKLGESCSVEDCAKMICSVDSDGDGNVNFDEFLKMMNSGAAAAATH